MEEKFILCPICHSKTRQKIRPNTIAVNLPVYCPKCRNISTFDIKDGEYNTTYI
jgi:phage FluMu protein Com